MSGIFRETDEWALCEWKGVSIYLDVMFGETVIRKGAWYFRAPFTDLGQPYSLLMGRIAFQPQAFTCLLDGHVARSQPGQYYGGWITRGITGPFKGAPGSEEW